MDLNEMERIQREAMRERDAGQLPLDGEGRVLAESKRMSIDIPEGTVVTDPLR